MAEGHMQQVLEKEITCPLCLDILREPKKLPCDHVYCKACLQQLANIGSKTVSVPCPECRALAQLTDKDIDNLPTAFRLNRLIEAFKHVQLAREETHCLSKSVATAAMEEVSECKVHLGQPLVLFCDTCSGLLCRDCVLATKHHSDHAYGFVSEMKEKLQRRLMDSALAVEGQSVCLSKAVNEISLIEDDIVSCERKCKREIDESFEVLYRSLYKHQQIMKQRVVQQLKLVHFSEKKKELILIHSEIETAVEQAIQSVQEDEQDFLMIHFPKNQQRLEQLKEKLSKTALTVTERPQYITPKVLAAEVLEQLLEKHNSLHSFDATKWQVSGRFLTDAQVGKRYSLTVESSKGLGKLWKASTNQKGITKLEAELICVRDQSTAQIEISEQSQDHFTVYVQPLVRGRHKLSIKVNGVHVSNSPFDVFVYIKQKQISKPVTEIPGLQRPVGLWFSEGKILVTEWGMGRLVELPVTALKQNELDLNTLVKMKGITAATTESQSGVMFVSTTDNHQVHKFNTNGDLIKTIGFLGTAPGAFDFPNGLRISKQDELYVCDSYNNRIQVFDLDLNFKRSFGSVGVSNGQFLLPSDVEFDTSEKIYISDSKNNRVQVFSPDEKFLFTIGDRGSKPLHDPVSLCFYLGLLYVTEIYSHRVSVVTPSGELVSRFGEGFLQNPEGITIDDDGYVYVTSHHSKILVF